MAKATTTTAAAATARPATPREVLQAKLVQINLAGKRFAEEEKWMKDAIEAALQKKLEAKLSALSDEAVAQVVDVLDMAK